MNQRWYQNAIIYCLDVDLFKDSNGDGIGDFAGLTQQLDYLSGLGVTCIWLLPFYPSPNLDDGYDVTDYYGIDPRLGDFGDFIVFMRQARERGIRVIGDLVINHTSDQHPWFQNARQGKGARYYDFYVWADEPPKDTRHQVIFPGQQESIWTYDEQAGAYYLHNFYEHQPDLNMKNPAVREELRKIMGFWLELGLSGFRIDAVPYAIGMEGIDGMERQKIIYEYLNEFREHLSWHRGDAILLAEANVDREKLEHYFGTGDRMHLLFNFQANQRLFLSLARKSAQPLREIMQNLPKIPETCEWVNFLRSHDELNLGKLDKEERQECFRAFGPTENMQIYGRGIRRRLAPMLNNDRRRILMAFSLMFSLPGTPAIWYGEEIGMGDDLSLPDRQSIRTPMQWSAERNGGFSSAPKEKLFRPVIDCDEFGFQRVNVENAESDASSILSEVGRMARDRRELPEIGVGEWRLLKTNDDERVFAHSCEHQGSGFVALHNFSDENLEVTVECPAYQKHVTVDLLGPGESPRLENGKLQVKLSPYGYRWLRLHRQD